MPDPVIQLQNVHKAYRQGGGRVEALRGVDLTLDEPAFVAVMGPSGSGKSTLLHLVAGLDTADRGRVVVDGQDLGQLSESRLTQFRRRRVGVVFQKFNLIPTLTAAQNVALPGVIDGRPRQWLQQRTAQLLDDLGLSARADHRPDAMSGGEQQRVAIARALLFDPPLLLADEPTGNLDSASSERLWRLLADLAAKQKITVLMVTHEPAAAVHGRRVYVLGDGRLRGEFEVNGLEAGGVASRYQQLGR
jgi:putative ABC transport system ATP-binding protein